MTNETASRPTYQQVARRAFEIYLARGGYDGEDHKDWEAAEAELGKAAERAPSLPEQDHPSANGDPSGVASMDP